MKKIAKLVVLIVIFLAMISYSNQVIAADEIIHIEFNNNDIYALTLQQLGDKILAHDDDQYTIDMKKTQITKVKGLSFDVENEENDDTTNLRGIEKFTKLEKLEISHGRIEDLSALKNLTKLTELKIYDCELTDIQDLQGLTNLKKLDLSANQINNIEPLRNLTKIEKLKLDKNQIVNIKPLQGMTKLTGLDLSSNRISDVSVLRNMKDLTLPKKSYENELIPMFLMKLINFEHLYLDDNQIVNISTLNKDILSYTSMQKQTLVVKTNKKEIELPKLFKNTKVELDNCIIDNSKSNIVIEDVKKIAEIRVTEGIFSQSVISIECDRRGPEITVTYEDSGEYNQFVKVIVTANEEVRGVEGWTLAENRHKLVKEYKKNKKEEINIKDIAGNRTTATIQVKNANKPILNVVYTTYENSAEAKGQEVIAEADKYLGNPYVLQGDSLTNGIDCSHFVYRILQICGLYDGKYLRSTNWISVGEEVKGLENAIAGDIIVWDGHVAFYDGNGKIVEAKGAKWGITHDRIAAKAIEKDTFLGIRRVTGLQKVEKVLNQNEKTNENVKVTITSNKKIKAISGWNLSKDGKTLTKIYKENTNETIIIRDYEENEIEKNISITNICK